MAGRHNGGMDTGIAYIQSLVASIAVLIPLGYAFGAGMISTVNPCGFALLPAYLSLYMGVNEKSEWQSGTVSRIFTAVLISMSVTLGFVILFAVAGGILRIGVQLITNAMPWAGFIIGIALVFLGLWLLVSRKTLHSGIVLRISSRVAGHIPNTGLNAPGVTDVPSFFLFGVAYGIASLSCTLPVFLIVVGSSSVTSGFLNGLAQGLLQFVSYAFGMGTVLLVLTLSMASFKGVMADHMRKGIPFVQRLSSVLVVGAGAFIVYYWLTTGELGRRIQDLF